MRFSISMLALSLWAPGVTWADPFAENVRTTDPLTPEEERAAFHLPPGFEVQLFAAEPDIDKPMNMAFDEKGRLWVTVSLEYPYAVGLDEVGRDSIKILEDRDGDGQAEHVTTFADGLNIPIGLLPWKGGAIGWSIPNIWHFDDTDDDAQSDQRTPLYGPLGWEKDTHGMSASYRRGFDGWIYATHGFNNESTIRGADGSELTIQSGNTYRLRTDGSRVEPHTFGQVNPFGLAFDSWGNLYSADCHSAPIYQLIPGAYYPSFGKPHDGLGFAPTMIEHTHSSTGICGIVYVEGNEWPAAWQHNILIGNCVTSRVNRDTIRFEGSSPDAEEMPDFITTDDPWFRPVDLQWGPDGALYVADFYNRIIGHYEVPLEHPGRDRERGRIWRISYTGDEATGSGALMDCDFTQYSVEKLLEELGSSNLTRRMFATNVLEDQHGKSAVDPVNALLSSSNATPLQVVHGLWVLHRLGALTQEHLASKANHSDGRVRAHVLKALRENPEIAGDDWLAAGIRDEEPKVQREAWVTLATRADVLPLGDWIEQGMAISESDDHLVHAFRIALRNRLQSAAEWTQLSGAQGGELIAGIALAVDLPEAGQWLMDHLANESELSLQQRGEYLQHAARLLPPDRAGELIALVQDTFAGQIEPQLALLQSVSIAWASTDRGLPPAAIEWAEYLTESLWLRLQSESHQWRYSPLDGESQSTNPWFVQERTGSNGETSSFFSSLPPGGESLTGRLVSASFEVPDALTFDIAGHISDRSNPAQNEVQLMALESGEILRRASPPSNDNAASIRWEFSEEEQGMEVRIQVLDQDTGAAYAWLAVGNFCHPSLTVPQSPPWNDLSAINGLIREFDLTKFEERIVQALGDYDRWPFSTQQEFAQTLLDLRESAPIRRALVSLLGADLPGTLRADLVAHILNPEQTDATLAELCFRTLPSRRQSQFAEQLAGSRAGMNLLIDLAEGHIIPSALLADRSVAGKFAGVDDESLKERLRSLTQDLPSIDESIQELIAQRRQGFGGVTPEIEAGAAVFKLYCAACHQIDGEGGVIGPQLTGIGNRGLERLLEDVLDPGRQIDPAFLPETVTLKNDTVLLGLFRREEGDQLVFADIAGQEIRVNQSEVESRKQSTGSLMPPIYGQALPEKDFYDLIAYLLHVR